MTERLNAIVGARIGEFRRKMAEARSIAAAFPKEITMTVNVKEKEFRKRMDRLADFYRDINTVGMEFAMGSLLTSIPALTGMIGGLAAALGGLGAQLGTVAGGFMGLASSFGGASIAGAGFASVAIPSITHVADLRKEVNSAMDAAAKAKAEGDQEGYENALAELGRLRRLSTEEQQKTVRAMNEFANFYENYWERFDAPVLQIFQKGMENLRVVMQRLQPMVRSTVEVVDGLFDSFRQSLDAPDVKRIIQWLNDNAARSLEQVSKSVGYLIRGFLNMLAAFSPLAISMEDGLLNMTKRFSEWTAGLEKSKRFNQFIEYVKTNGPVLLGIVGDIIVGLVEMFAAFGPMSTDMMKGIKGLTERFKNWASTLSENTAFQDFIDYVQRNAPEMLKLIGNVVDFLIEMGKGFAWVGEKMMPMINSFLDWSTALMENNPNIARSIALFGVFFGLFKMAAVPIALFKTIFRGLWPAIKAFGKSLVGVRPLLTQFWAALKIGGQHLLRFAGLIADKFFNFLPRIIPIVGRVIMSFMRFLGLPGLIITALILIVQYVVKHWDQIKEWTVTTFNAIWTTTKAVWNNIVTTVTTFVLNLVSSVVAKYQQIKAQTTAIFNAIKIFIVSTWQSMVQSVIKFVMNFVNNVRNGWNAVKNFTTSVFNAVKTFIVSTWKSMVNTVVQAVQNFVNNVRNGWNAVKNFTTSVFNAVKNFIVSTWNSIKSTTQSVVSSFTNFIRDKYNQIKNNIQTVMRTVWNFIKTTWNNIKNTIRDAVQNVLQTVRDKFQQLVSAVREKMNSAWDTIKSIWDQIKSFFDGIDLAASGRKIIGSLIDGIKGMTSKVTDAVGGVAQKVRDFWPFSPPKEGPLIDLHRMDFGWAVARSIDSSKREVGNAASRLAEMAQMDIGASYNANVGVSETVSSGKYERRGSSSNTESSRGPINVTNHFNSTKDSPYEDARKQKQAMRRLAESGVF